MMLKITKILRKSQGSIYKITYFCWPKINVSFKMLKIEFKYEYKD